MIFSPHDFVALAGIWLYKFVLLACYLSVFNRPTTLLFPITFCNLISRLGSSMLFNSEFAFFIA